MAARTKEEIDNMSKEDQAWASLAKYDTAMEDSDNQYAKGISSTNNAALARGMQRSSYLGQTTANLENQRIKARNDLGAQKAAAYASLLRENENQEWQRGFQERQLEENIRQADRSYDFQVLQAEEAKRQWQLAFDQGNSDSDRNVAYNYVNAMLAKGQMPSDDLLARAGISRADAQKLLAQTAAGGGGGGGRGTQQPKPEEEGAGNGDNDVQAFINGSGGYLTKYAPQTASNISNANMRATLATFEGATDRLAGKKPADPYKIFK